MQNRSRYKKIRKVWEQRQNIVDNENISNILKHCNISYMPKNQSITYFRRFHRIIAHMDIYSIDRYDSSNFQQL